MPRRLDGPWPVWEILPGMLYQRAKLHGKTRDEKVAGVEFWGLTHAVALAPATPDPDLPSILDYVHLPIPDHKLGTRHDLLLDLAHSMAHEIEENDATVVTMCNAGRNRSGLLSALIVRELLGIPGRSAMEVVRAHRPRALANDYFAEWLDSLP